MTGKILVVDPVATNRIVLKAKLSAQFYDAESVASADLARAAVENAIPDLLLISDRLPGLDTAVLCRALRAGTATSDLPIVILSDESPGPDRAACLLAGADDILDRRTGDATLFARIRSLISDAGWRNGLASRLVPSTFADAAQIDWTAGEPGTIGWISAARATSLSLQAKLGLAASGRVKTLDPSTILGAAPDAAEPELYVIDHEASSGLALLSDLNARVPSRAAMCLMLMTEADHMAAAYDLGAGSVLAGPIEPQEIMARLMALSRRKRQRDRLRLALDAGLALAIEDPLTGLQNRRSSMDGMAALATSARPSGVLMMDIDHFKSVNDRLGHAAGDAVIAAVASALRQSLTHAEVLGRIGGEEFLAVVPAGSAAEVREIAAKACRAIASLAIPVPNAGLTRITISIGAAFWADERAAQDMMAKADAALYRAKRAGRNRVCMSETLIA